MRFAIKRWGRIQYKFRNSEKNQADATVACAASVSARITVASRAAVDEYVAAAKLIFEQCTARYVAGAAAVNVHENAANALSEAWPRLRRVQNSIKRLAAQCDTSYPASKSAGVLKS